VKRKKSIHGHQIWGFYSHDDIS